MFFNTTPFHFPPGPSFFDTLDDSTFKSLHVTFLDNALKYFHEYGPIIQLPSKRHQTIDIISPSAIEHVFLKNSPNYDKSHAFWKRLQRLTGNGILTREMQEWETHQKILQKGFHKKQLKRYAEIINRHMADAIQTLNERTRIDTPINLLDYFTRLTLKMMATILFQIDLSDQEIQTIHGIIQFGNQHISHALFLHPYLPSVKNLWFAYQKHRLKQFIQQQIDKQRAQSTENEPTLFSFLLASDLTDNEIQDELITLLITGHETLATHLTWAVYLLAQSPEKALLLASEAKSVLAQGVLTYESLGALSYTEAVIKESLRLYPPLWCILRTAKEKDTLNGFDIKRHCVVRLHVYAAHRYRPHWVEPNAFLPERFLLSTPKAFTYLPFGAGPRSCIGSHLATLEAKIILAHLLSRFKITLLNKRSIHPKPLITLQPNRHIHVRFTEC